MFKSPRDAHVLALEQFFKRNLVAQLPELRGALKVRSRTTVFFALKTVGYLTSYTHAGRYYTLTHIPRFDEHGYPGLEEFASRAPAEPSRTPRAIEDKVIALRRANPEWGKRRIADELTKENNWEPLVSPNTVRRILEGAGLWKRVEAGEGGKGG